MDESTLAKNLIRDHYNLEVSVFWAPPSSALDYQGEALALSSQNELGVFDVLPNHANFISTISDKITIYTSKNQIIQYTFKTGILEVTDNKVKVFLES